MAEIDEKINEAFIEIERLKSQAKYMEGLAESERGTLQRLGTGLREEIDRVEKKFHDIIFNSDTGLLLAVDRLKQESTERKKIRNHIYALWVFVAGWIIEQILILFTAKK